MTGMLKDLMHERAERLEEFRPDLDAIVDAGDRRVRRRRAMAGAAGVAAVVALVITVPAGLQLREGADDGTDVTVGTTRSVTWAEGDTIHVGADSIDVGHQIHAFVATTEGFVFADPAGGVWSWTDGEATKVGEADTSSLDNELHLVADGPWAGWVESGRDTPFFMFLDQTAGAGILEVRASDRTAEPAPYLLAIDGSAAYVRDGTDLVRVDLRDGRREVIAHDPESRLEIHDVEGGLILLSRGGDEDDGGTSVTRDLSRPGAELSVRGGDLSPSGRYVMSENSAASSDDFTVIELASGEVVNPSAKADYAFFLGYAWLDDDTYAAFGINGIGEADSSEETIVVDLLTCHVSSAECSALPGAHPAIDTFQIPVGVTIS